MHQFQRSKWLILAVVVAVLQTGCMATTFEKAGGSPQSFEADKNACLYDAKLHQPNDAYNWPSLVQACLIAKGWHPVSVRYDNGKQGWGWINAS
jgi:hypothetical protein